MQIILGIFALIMLVILCLSFYIAFNVIVNLDYKKYMEDDEQDTYEEYRNSLKRKHEKWDKLTNETKKNIQASIQIPKQVQKLTNYENSILCFDEDGTKKYYKKGLLHREDGPAIEYINGNKEWYKHGLLHREDGPAIEYEDGSKEWFINGQYHKEDGPAVVWSNGYKEWWINNKKLSEEEFLSMTKISSNPMCCKTYNTTNKYVDNISGVLYYDGNKLEKITVPDNKTCKMCNFTDQYGIANQIDGSYICYNCK